MINSCEIRPGGKLFYLPGPGEGCDPGWVERTGAAPRHLFDTCQLAAGVTLRDLLLILRRDIDLYTTIMGQWVEELVAEGLDKPVEPSNLEYLELSWAFTASACWGKHKGGKELSGYTFPGFHGHGPDPETREDLTWGLAFSPAYTLVDLPLQLNSTLTISDEEEFFRHHRNTGEFPPTETYDTVYQDCTYTLGQILHGVIWELTFHGGPVAREAQRAELNRLVLQVDSGEAVTYSTEEVRAMIDKFREKDTTDD